MDSKNYLLHRQFPYFLFNGVHRHHVRRQLLLVGYILSEMTNIMINTAKNKREKERMRRRDWDTKKGSKKRKERTPVEIK